MWAPGGDEIWKNGSVSVATSSPVSVPNTPGMMLTARALLDRNPNPSDGEIREAISGQICRCTGYATIVRSIRWAADHEAAAAGAPAPTEEGVTS